MRSLKYLFAATMIIALASPALAQSDPHHPDKAETAPAVDAADAALPTETPVPATTEANTTACPDMMLMQPETADTQSMMMQMMQMMQSMQMMQMQLTQQMQQMQPGMQQQVPDEETSP